jgi:hypothetical protein
MTVEGKRSLHCDLLCEPGLGGGGRADSPCGMSLDEIIVRMTITYNEQALNGEYNQPFKSHKDHNNAHFRSG